MPDENVAPLTPVDMDLLRSLAATMPVLSELACPHPGCRGREGEHGALIAETWTGDTTDHWYATVRARRLTL